MQAWAEAFAEGRVGSINRVSLHFDTLCTSKDQALRRARHTLISNFAQCGHTNEKLDWLMEQIRDPQPVNLNPALLSLAVAAAIKSK